MQQIQRHRGLSSGWLAGDAGFAERLATKQAAIAVLLPEIKVLARRALWLDESFLSSNQLALFAFRWQCLLDELPGLTPEQSIARHNQTISRILEWLAALGEQHIERRHQQDGRIGFAHNFSCRLPQLTECLGQARAIGMSVAARRTCTPVARVRLMFLIGRAEALFEQAVAASDGVTESGECRQAIVILAATVRTRMLMSSGVVVGSSEYFALATTAIDAVYAWIEACAQHLAPAGSASVAMAHAS
jgi:hypothetical protein